MSGLGPDPPESTIPGALARAARIAPSSGIVFVSSSGPDRDLSYGEVWERAKGAAGAFATSGVRAGDRLIVVLPTGDAFLSAFFGAMLAGAIPCPVSPPAGLGAKEAFVRRLGSLASAVGARAVVTDDDGANAVREAVAECEILLAASLEAGDRTLESPDPRDADPEAVAFLQFTSGTTGGSKAVRLTHRAVMANLRAIHEATRIDAGSVVVSWLPMFHDMGVIGGLLNAVSASARLVLGTPFGFVRRPVSWLEAIHRHRGTHSPAPNFAYRLVADRVREAEVEGLDLSCWVFAYAGAEMVQAEALRAFARRLERARFSESALAPCYGLAESSLAVTLSPPGRGLLSRPVSARRLAREGLVRPPDGPGDVLELVACGRAVPGTEVAVLAEDGASSSEDRVGEVVVRGRSLYSGYWGVPGDGTDGGWLRTGDLGFLAEGDLYLTGRKKDLIILHGENHSPAEVEWVVAGVDGVREGKVAAFGVSDPASGTEGLCLLVEISRRPQVDLEEIQLAIRRRVHEQTGLPVAGVVFASPGSFPLTTSGKIQRSRARDLFLEMQGDRGPRA